MGFSAPGSRSFAASCTRPRRPPTRSTPESHRPPSRGRATSSRFSARSGVGARLFCPAPHRSSARASRKQARSSASSSRPASSPVKVDDADLGRYLEREGRLVHVGDGYAVAASAYEQARRIAVDECEKSGSITLARFRDLLGTGRRPAQLLLERFDADGLTRRTGEERVLRRREEDDPVKRNVEAAGARRRGACTPSRRSRPSRRSGARSPSTSPRSDAQLAGRRVVDAHPVLSERRHPELRRPRLGNRRAHELVDEVLDGEEEGPRASRNGVVRRVETREGRLAVNAPNSQTGSSAAMPVRSLAFVTAAVKSSSGYASVSAWTGRSPNTPWRSPARTGS